MPLCKYGQPSTLEALSSARVSRLALDSCLQIQQRFPVSQHQAEAKKIQQYLQNICPLLEDVFNQAIHTARTNPLHVEGGVLVTAMAHPRIKTFSYPYLQNMRERASVHFVFHSGLAEVLLAQLPNLVKLDLSGVGYEQDRILEVVSRSCQKLEIIYICAKTVTEKTCRYFVNLKYLRAIKRKGSFTENPFNMINLRLHDPGNIKGVRLLVQSLPLLEWIPFYSRGDLLASLKDVEFSSLREWVECVPNEQELEAIVQKCPKLESLHLRTFSLDTIPFRVDLSPITKSALKLSSLELSNLNIAGRIEDLFQIKGGYIKHLKLYRVGLIDLDTIYTIVGNNCPSIEVLHITTVSHWGEEYQPNEWGQKSTKPMFANLIEFSLTFFSALHGDLDAYRYPWMRLVACLVYAKQIKSLTLKVASSSDSIAFERAMCDLLAQNPMSELENIEIGHCDLESKQLANSLMNLPKMANLRMNIYFNPSVALQDYVRGVKSWIEAKNLNLTFTVRHCVFGMDTYRY